MEGETFVSDGWHVKATLFLAIGMIGMAIILFVWMRPSEILVRGLVVVQGTIFLLLGGHNIWAWTHRKRPVLEISPDSLEFGSIYPFTRRQRVEFREMAEIRLIDGLIAAETRLGDTVTIDVKTLSQESRQRALGAIQRRLAELRSSSR